jgi:hypothetical protein
VNRSLFSRALNTFLVTGTAKTSASTPYAFPATQKVNTILETVKLELENIARWKHHAVSVGVVFVIHGETDRSVPYLRSPVMLLHSRNDRHAPLTVTWVIQKIKRSKRFQSPNLICEFLDRVRGKISS